MDGKGAFDKENLKTINIDKRDPLEELGLPPEVISFIRKNKRSLQLGGVLAIVAILAWSGINSYLDSRHEKSTSMLAAAIKPSALEERAPLLEKVVEAYSSTDAALWARIEMANDAAVKKDFDKAIAEYKAVLDALPSNSSLRPLIHMGLATAYEDSDKKDLAEAEYKKLTAYPPFASEGYLAMGRLLEGKGDYANAADMYAKAQSEKDSPMGSTEWAKYKETMLKSMSENKAEEKETDSTPAEAQGQ